MYPKRNDKFRPRPERRQEDNDQMIYGIRPVIEAINAGKELDRLFIGRGAKGELMAELKDLLKTRMIPWTDVPVEKLNRLTRNNHQDVVGFISTISYAKLEDVVPGIFERGETPFIIMLDRVTDVRNFGAIARTAECAGVHAIVIPAKGAAQVSADAIKTSAGALNRITVCRENNLRSAIEFLHQSGVRVAAATEKGKTDYFDNDLTGPIAIVMGSEEDGVSNDIIRLADELCRIPLMGKISSLNVSVAAGVLMYEVVRLRRTTSAGR